MEENFMKPVEGYFTIEALRDGEVVDTFESSNKIMISSKKIMAYTMMGTGLEGSANPPISTVVLGTAGYADGNLLVPKSFDYTKTNLFSEDAGTAGGITGTAGDTWPITWDPSLPATIPGLANTYTVIDEGYTTNPNLAAPSGDASYVQVTTDTDGINYTITYTFTIHNGNANGKAADLSDKAIAWTEAALYVHWDRNLAVEPKQLGEIFAMRTFPAKIKDNATSFKITWKVIF